jgi:hypothetical protein
LNKRHKQRKCNQDEQESRRRLIQLATWALIVAHDVLRLIADALNR